MKKIFTICIMMIFLISALPACENDDVPDDIVSFYLEFLDTSKSDLDTATRQYCYFKSQEEYEIMASSTDYLLSYEINSWEQLSNDLWAVQITIKSIKNPESNEYSHFVGRFDDRYWVMIGTTRIPDTLKAGCDLSRYLNKNAIEFDDLIK